MRAAAAAGALTALQAVIQHGGTKLPIDGTADDDRCTALHIAAFRGHDDCVAALVTPARRRARATASASPPPTWRPGRRRRTPRASAESA